MTSETSEMNETSEPAEIIVRLEDVCVDRRDRRVLENISFEVAAGDFVGLVGPNGAGKTTLLKTLLGLAPVSSGRIEILGRAPRGRRGAPEGVGYVPQRHSIAAHFPASVNDVVSMGRLRMRGPFSRISDEDRKIVARNLESVGIADLAQRPVGELSGGQQRRVMLAQALCASARLLILDEPTIGLDLPAEHEFYSLLRELQRDLGLTVIAVSHDLVALAGECDELICINRRMHIHGHPEDVIHSHAIQEAYSCEFDFLAGEIAHHEGGAEHQHGSHDHSDHRHSHRGAGGVAPAGGRRRSRGRLPLMLEFEFMQRALVASITDRRGLRPARLSSSILRRLAFIGVGISHSALGGVAIGILVGVNPLLHRRPSSRSAVAPRDRLAEPAHPTQSKTR